MAISFSRPDPSSPAAVAEAAFGTARRGFDQQEVRDFLRMVAAELARLQERERFLERELRSAQLHPPGPGAPPVVDEDTVTRLLGEETARILTIARESATQTKARAEDGAARLLREATDEANHLREQAELEAARRCSDAAADAEAELAMAKQQGREMVEEARAYRERVLNELSRRRELARQQIDQLIHGRDRLVQAFERARLVAADVVTELAPLHEPDEYVDLTPTTGPVPITVPAGQLGDHSSVGSVRLPGEGLDDDNPFVTDATGEIELAPPSTTTTTTDGAEGEGAEGEPADLDGDPVTDEVDGDSGAGTEAIEEPGDPDEEEAALAEAAPVADGTEEQEETTAGERDESVAARPGAQNVLAFPAVPAPAADAGADDESDEEIDDDATATDVDDLFARLRATRDATAAAAPSPDEPTDAAGVADAEMPGGDDDTPFGARESALVPLIVTSARKLKRRLADEQNEVLDALRRKEPVTSLDVLLPWESEQSERYVDAIAAELVAAAEAGAASVPGAPSLDVGPTGLLAPTREALAVELVVPMRERLTRAVDDAEGDNDVIAKKVRGIYREWKTQRIDEQLDDLFRSVYARAAFEAIGPGARVGWIVDPDGPASPDCEDNSLQEPIIAGDAFPTGHAHPPAHPGCRCLLEVIEE